jgi:hypothetical protein
MRQEDRSVWDQLYWDVEPWRRGRVVLVWIAALNFLLQALDVALQIVLGDIERVLFLAAVFVLLWLQFYLIWIGIHWIRWIAGAWTGVTGFCFLIWGVRDNNPIVALLGAINLVVATYLCLSPSVYAFAQRQRETVRWKEAVAIAAICLLILGSIAAGLVGVWQLRAQQIEQAGDFAEAAAQHVYVESDFEWATSHVTAKSLEKNGRSRLHFFIEDNKARLRGVRHISQSSATVRGRFRFPAQFAWYAHVICRAESDDGPAKLHFVLAKTRMDWEIEHMWWEYLPLP